MSNTIFKTAQRTFYKSESALRPIFGDIQDDFRRIGDIQSDFRRIGDIESDFRRIGDIQSDFRRIGDIQSDFRRKHQYFWI